MDNVGTPISRALMHDSVFLPGPGEIKKELSTVSSGIERGVKMTLLDSGLVLLEVRDEKTKTIYELLVPVTNFKYLLKSKKPILTPPLKSK